jgi:lipopolysaccharide transport system permease protein
VISLVFGRNDLRMGWNLFQIALRDRFIGSGLGLVWAIANPAMLLTIFTFVFGFVFQPRLPGAKTSLSFVVWLVSGYGPWLAISEGLATSTSSLTANAGLIKNLVFKRALLPMVGTMMGLVPLAVATIYLVGLLAFERRTPNASWLILPVVTVLQFFVIAGIGLVLAGINVFVRDTALVLPNVLTLLLFASPIFYPVASFPRAVQTAVQLNPFYVIAEGYRDPVINGVLPPLWSLVYLAALAAVLFLAGLAFFRRLEPHFDARL